MTRKKGCSLVFRSSKSSLTLTKLFIHSQIDQYFSEILELTQCYPLDHQG